MSSVLSSESSVPSASSINQGTKISKLSSAIAASLSSSNLPDPASEQRGSHNHNQNYNENHNQKTSVLSPISPSNSFLNYNHKSHRLSSFGSTPHSGDYPHPSPIQTGNGANYSGPTAMSINSNLKHGNQFSSDSTAARSPAASSMIFERSVQDNFLTGSPSFYNKKLLPSSFSPCTNHHTQEDFIPAVLDASTQALARNNVNPDNINVISARHPSAVPLSGPGSPVTAHGNNEFSGTPFSNGNPLSRNRTNSINNTFSALSRNSSGTNLTTVRNTLSNSGLSSPNNNSSNMHGFTPVISRLSRTNSIQTQNRIDRQDHYGEQSRENPEGETPSVLSFYSFADVIKTEGASSTSPKTTTNHASFDSSNTAPSDGGPICRHMSTSSNYIPHTALFTKHQLASHPSNGNGDNDNCAFSFQDNESDDTDDGLHMSSLGDTLRKCSISCAER